MSQLQPEQLTTTTAEINERIAAHHRRWALNDPPTLLEGQVEIAVDVIRDMISREIVESGLPQGATSLVRKYVNSFPFGETLSPATVANRIRDELTETISASPADAGTTVEPPPLIEPLPEPDSIELLQAQKQQDRREAGDWAGISSGTQKRDGWRLVRQDDGRIVERTPCEPNQPGDTPYIPDQDQLRIGIRDYTAYPSLNDAPNGADVLADDLDRQWAREREAEAQGVAMTIEEDRLYSEIVEPPLIEPLPEPIAIPVGAPKPTNGNGHATPSPAAVATLGPEHTVVTPIVPRRSGVGDAPRQTFVEKHIGMSSEPAATEETINEASAEPTPRISADALAADLQATIHALQTMAEDGVMPSLNSWRENRPAGMLTGQGILSRHQVTWNQLAALAGLKPQSRHSRSDSATEEGVPELGATAVPLAATEPMVHPIGIPQPAPETHQEAMRRYRQERRELLLKTVRELSVDGSMVTMADYNAKKPAELGNAGEMMNQLGYTEWGEVAKDAGVKWFGPRGKSK